MEQKRKTSLFRFVTLRAPQLISSERRALGFVEHPDPSSSHFLDAIDGYTDINTARTTLSAQAATFTAYESVDDVKNVSTDLWDFSLWLMKNKNNLVRSELDALIPALPTATKINKLWDNLFYDILLKKDGAIRQGCLQMIVAINFINKYVSYSPGVSTDEDVIAEEARLLKRLANGKVIVDRAFTIAKVAISAAPLGLASKSYVRHEAIHKAYMAGLEIAPLESIKGEFCSLKETYKSDYKTAYDSAYSTYKTQSDATIAQYITDNNLQEPITEDDIPSGVVEEFEFTYDSPLSSTYTSGKLSSEALAYLNKACFNPQSIDQVLSHIDKDIKSKKQLGAGTKHKKYSEVLIKGTPVKPGTSVHHDYAFSIVEVAGSQQNSVEVYATFNAGYSGSFLKTPTFTITMSGTDYSHVVSIRLTNSYSGDFKNAFEKMGIFDRTTKEEILDKHVWHHFDDFEAGNFTSSMQLSKIDAHKATLKHVGSKNQLEEFLHYI